MRLDLTNRAMLLANLRLLYCTMLASEPLLAAALKQDLPVWLRRYYAAHWEQERDHAKWLAEDLAGAGVPVATIDMQWKLAAACIVGPIYYLIFHGDPVALLGYMLALEGAPMSVQTIERLEKIHGTALLRTLRYHAVHDQDHGRDLSAVIEKANRSQRALIDWTRIMTLDQFGAAFAHIAQAEAA